MVSMRVNGRWMMRISIRYGYERFWMVFLKEHFNPNGQTYTRCPTLERRERKQRKENKTRKENRACVRKDDVFNSKIHFTED